MNEHAGPNNIYIEISGIHELKRYRVFYNIG